MPAPFTAGDHVIVDAFGLTFPAVVTRVETIPTVPSTDQVWTLFYSAEGGQGPDGATIYFDDGTPMDGNPVLTFVRGHGPAFALTDGGAPTPVGHEVFTPMPLTASVPPRLMVVGADDVTVQVPGLYAVDWQARFEASAAAGRFFSAPSVNGVTGADIPGTPRTGVMTGNDSTTFGDEHCGHTHLMLAVGDVLRLLLWQDSGGPVDGSGHLRVVQVSDVPDL